MINKNNTEFTKSFWIRRIRILIDRLNLYDNTDYDMNVIEDEINSRDIDYCISVYTHYQKIYNSHVDKLREVEYER